MEDIQIGEYVRDKYGIIGKMFSITYEPSVDIGIGIMKEVNAVWLDDENKHFIELENILKHSENIIDLVEVGDYVNGYKVLDYDLTYFNGVDRLQVGKKIGVIVDNGQYNFKNYIKKEDIKTIVTKEQFAQIQYNLEEE